MAREEAGSGISRCSHAWRSMPGSIKVQQQQIETIESRLRRESSSADPKQMQGVWRNVPTSSPHR